MANEAQAFRRVRQDVEAISTLMRQVNLPIEAVLDKTSLNALCECLTYDPKLWDLEFLETILIIREGLIGLRDTLRDENDGDAIFATEQFLNALDRLHTDLFLALRSLNPSSVNEAQKQIADLVRTPYIDVRSIRNDVTELRADANELLTRTHITFQRFEVHLLRVHEAEVMRTAKLVVQRMSATAFAIKVSLERSVIYQGTFRFLQEGADKIVDELKAVTEHFKIAYKDEKEFSEDLTRLVEKGSKLTRDIGNLLHQVFSDGPIQQKQLRLKTQNTLPGASMVCALRLDADRVLLGGQDGWICVLDIRTGRAIDRHQMFEGRTINSLSRMGSSAIVAGTQKGMETINPTTIVSRDFSSMFEENVAAVAVTPWGLVSGTRDGIARRWILDDETIVKYGAENLRLGRSIQRMTVVDETVIVAAGQTLFFINDRFKVDSQVPIDFEIRDMCRLDHKSLIICGDGKIAHVMLGHKYTKYLAASEEANYTCIAPIDTNTFCVGNDDGVIAAIDRESSAEIGVANVQFPVRGMLRVNDKLLAYGGSWQSKNRSIAMLDWEEVVHRSKPVEMD